MSSLNWPAIGATILPNFGGFAGSLITKKAIPEWYSKLNKPSWNPPNYIFGPVWTALYSSMGYASYLVWRDGGGFEGEAALPLALYGGQLALNWLWTPIFFGKRNIKGGLCVIIGILGGAISAAASMYQINETAGLIMVPYIAWLSFATAINYTLLKLNPDNDDGKNE